MDKDKVRKLMSDNEPYDFAAFYKKLCEQPVYLFYEYEDCVLRSVPGGGWFVKFRSKQEFKAQHGSKLVVDAQSPPVEITKEEYEKF